MKLFSILIYYIYLSIFVRSINKNISNLTIMNNRIRNTSLRFFVFNDFYRKLKEKFIKLVKVKNNNKIIDNSDTYLLSNYYDLCYRYYSLSEDDRTNLDFIIALLFLGPKKLPELAKGLGQAVREFQKARDEMMNEVNKPHQATAQADVKKDVEVTATKVETSEANIVEPL